jgi:hypothetical protein
MGKSTISMVIFNSELLNYRRVHQTPVVSTIVGIIFAELVSGKNLGEANRKPCEQSKIHGSLQMFLSSNQMTNK